MSRMVGVVPAARDFPHLFRETSQPLVKEVYRPLLKIFLFVAAPFLIAISLYFLPLPFDLSMMQQALVNR